MFSNLLAAVATKVLRSLNVAISVARIRFDLQYLMYVLQEGHTVLRMTPTSISKQQ